MQRDPDLLATVLEDEHVLDATSSRKVAVAIGPDLGQSVEPLGWQGRKRSVVLVGVDDHLAQAASRRPGHHGRKPILEDSGLKPGRGNLGRMLGLRWAERAVGALR